MKAFLIVLLAVFFQGTAMAETIPESLLLYERYWAKVDESTVMLCTVKRYAEGYTGEKCDNSSSCPICSLGINRSKEAGQILANLLALKLDEEFASSLRCMIRIRGKPFISQLQKLDSAQARKHCLTKLQEATTAIAPSKVTPEQVCNTEENIRASRDDYIDEIKMGKVCDPWNID